MYGLTIENEKLIREKAKDKKDGCYRLRGVAYRVKNGKVIYFGCDGKVLEPFGAFNVLIGRYEGGMDSAVKILKGIDN